MSRSTRRTTRRTAVVDSDDELSMASVTQFSNNDEEDELAPDTSVASTSTTTSRRTTRGARKSSAPAPAATTRARGRPKKTPTPKPQPKYEESADEDEPDVAARRSSTASSATVAADDVDEDDLLADVTADATVLKLEDQVTQLPSIAVRASTPKKRQSSVPSSSKTNAVPPTPQTSQKRPFPMSTPMLATPLTNMTTSNLDTVKRNDGQTTIRANKFNTSIMDKPLDIMLKSRTTAIPFIEETPPKSRTVLSYLVLENFKSYAGRQEVGPFHASFTSVVGPNGSGKSNVIDSLLFVFGFRASKMRQGKISALIHNSAGHPNLPYCEVAVYFKEVMDRPGGGSDDIPDSQLIVSRKAFKNNTSKYYINGKESNFTQVTTLLRDRGVDLDHKRFLILQGEVESIAQMKPKAPNEHDDGLLEYLEDIIGTSKYKSPIEESAAEVEALNEVCAEKNGRVQHVEKEKNSLEDKKDKATAFMRDENDLFLKQSALYQLYIHECKENISVTEEAINQMQAQLDVELEKHQGGEQTIKDLQKQYAKGNKSFEVQEKETQSLVKEMSKFEHERADETIEQCSEELDTRTKELVDLEEQVKTEEAELASIREELKGKTQEFSDQIATKQKALEPWTEKINQKQSAIAVAESELNILQEKANAGAVAIEELKGKISSAQEHRVAKQKELKACEAEKAGLLQEAERMKSELKVLVEQEPKMRNKISNARQKADEARSNLASTQARGTVLTALMRMKESGRIDGFHGRLGSLGTIDSRYDVAISTACAALDNFVTETVDAGQQCIEHLRKNNLGRGNFICLDKMRSRDLSAIQTPENAPRLFDLVQAKEDKFRPAFYHALQDTLVASDLAQANRIAYGAKRWRVVTLAGELIDKSGTMSGGGATAKKGLMSSKQVADISREHVTQLEEDRDSWEGKYQEFQEYQRECETRLREISDKVPRLDTDMQKITLELESTTRNLGDLQRRVKEEVTKLNREIEKLHGETSSLEAEIKALQDKIMEVGGEKLRAQRAKVDSIKEEISSNQEEISNAEVRRAKAEKQKVKLSKDVAKATKELSAAEQDLESLDHDVNHQGEKADELRTRVEEAEEALAATKKELKALKTDLDEKMSELNETRAVEIEMRNKLEENQKALTENQRRLRYWQDKLSKISLHDINELTGGQAQRRKKSPKAQPQPRKQKQQSDESGEEGIEDEEMEDASTGDADSDKDVEMADAQSEEGQEKEAGEAEDMEEGEDGDDDDQSIVDPQQLPVYTPDELADMNKDKLKGEIAALEEKTQNVNIDLAVLAEYRKRVEEYAARSSDLQAAIEQRDAGKKRCDDLRRLRLEGFMDGLSVISLRLKEMYQLITMGGNAELELVDSLDPFSEGIQFSVMPPKKSWKNISNLSGGEKTLSSLALVFALHHYKPTPLYVMDEIDAALDFRNVSIVANYIKERTKNAQFIVISLRNNMFELAARLVGVYKVNHMTKSVTIENNDYIQRPGRPSQSQQSQSSQQRPGSSASSGLTTTLAMR
ncbi:structural maintenance of chromosome 4 [Geosmithia morbida]|uniref:Structural maintenance of chromosomes protein n=1 Tax=Geosmithia morbida TaxID=1094350 RepID=A0A9P4Z409_9HYPO|nr:structural maintenance of chromosome 4 [Geosmithia morbida]KAF4126224.1 structural maintenance of chromosome 4 [Geosmithia morbida]